jgi:hypothetical protein
MMNMMKMINNKNKQNIMIITFNKKNKNDIYSTNQSKYFDNFS